VCSWDAKRKWYFIVPSCHARPLLDCFWKDPDHTCVIQCSFRMCTLSASSARVQGSRNAHIGDESSESCRGCVREKGRGPQLSISGLYAGRRLRYWCMWQIWMRRWSPDAMAKGGRDGKDERNMHSWELVRRDFLDCHGDCLAANISRSCWDQHVVGELRGISDWPWRSGQSRLHSYLQLPVFRGDGKPLQPRRTRFWLHFGIMFRRHGVESCSQPDAAAIFSFSHFARHETGMRGTGWFNTGSF